MCATCTYALVMSVMIQIRHVPDELHRLLKARAEEVGTSLSDYLLLELRRTVERPTREQLMARLKRRSRVAPKERPAAAVRAERNAR
jgi:antitoxin FitA